MRLSPIAIGLSGLLLAGCQTTMDPPAVYDHRYTGELHLHYADQDGMKAQCLAFDHTNRIFGCAFAWGKSCDVWILKTESAESRKQILRHELAHCNGWPADHGDGTQPPNDGGAPWPDPFMGH